MAFKVGAIYGEAILNTDKWDKGTSKINSALKTSLKAVTVFTAASAAALTAYFVKASQKANIFQKSLSNVNTLLSEGQANIADMGKELLLMDSSLGSTIELTDGLYQAISAGADPASNAIQTVTDSAIFAKAALTDVYTAVDVLTTVTNAYGEEVVNTTQAADILFTTIKQGKINGEQLASTIGQSIPLFASLNIPLEQLSSGLAAMTKQGINASESTTQLNAIVNSFLKPSEEMKMLIQEIGFESGSAFLEAEGLTGALDLLQESTGGNATELAKLLPNVRALRGAMALTGVGGKEFISILEEMEDATGASREAFEKQEKTWDTLRNEIEKTQIIVGNIVKFFADDFAGGLTDATNSINKFLLSAEGFNIISETIVNTAGAFAVLGHISGSVFTEILAPGQRIVETIVDLINDLNEETNTSIDTFSLLGGIVNYFSSIIRIAGEYVAGLIDVVAQWIRLVVDAGKTAQAFFDALTGKGTWEEFGIQAKEAGGQLLDVGKSYVDFYKNMVNTTMDSVTNITQTSKEEAEKQRQVWIDTTTNMRSKVSDNYEKMMIGIFSTTEDGIENQEDLLNEGGEDLGKKFGAGLKDGITSELKGLDKVINDWVKSLPENVQQNRSKFQKAWEDFVEPVLEMVSFIGQNISDVFNSIFDTVVMGLENQLSVIQASNQEKLAEMQENKDKTLEELDSQNQEELEKLQERRELGLITDEEYNALKEESEEMHAMKKAEIEDKYNKKIEEQKKKSRERENAKKKEIFEAQKANQIANIWIQYALGLMGLWAQSIAQLGPIAGSIFAGIMTGVLTGIAIAQTVVVAQQQFIPEKAMGGMASGLTRVNEKGGEIISLPDGSQVIPHDISSMIAANAGSDMGSKIIYNVIMKEAFAGAYIAGENMYEQLMDILSEKLSKRLKLTI